MFQKFKDRTSKYEFLLPSLIFIVANNIAFYIKKPELAFEYYDYFSSIFLSVSIWGWLYYLTYILPFFYRFTAKLLLAIFFALTASLSYAVYSEFGQFISFAMLSFIKRDPEYIKSFSSLYLKEYWLVFIAFLIPLLAFLFNTPLTAAKTSSSKIACLIFPGLILIFASYSDFFNKNCILLPDVTLLISSYRAITCSDESQHTLNKPERDKLKCKTINNNAPDVFIIVNESLGRKLFSIQQRKIFNPCMPLLVNLINNNPSNWFVFENSLSSSTATDVSLPSIFTGLAPTAQKSQFYKNPLLWEFLKSVNPTYYTIFSSPVDFKWANLEAFFELNNFNKYIPSSSLQGGLINDLGKDEYFSAKAFASAIKEAPISRPVFGFYFSNSLHSPFQKESAYLNKSQLCLSRFCIAQTILDHALNDIISAIVASGRSENSLIFILGDHGDSDKININGHRLYSFREDYWSTLLLVYASNKIQSKYLKKFKVFQNNTQSLVASIDLYPSLVDLLSDSNDSESLTGGFHGFSLFQPIPLDRVLIGLNTNGLRSWPQEGFGIAKGQTRMIFNNVHGFSFYDLSTDPNQAHDTFNTMENAMRNYYLDIINHNPELLRVLSPK